MKRFISNIRNHKTAGKLIADLERLERKLQEVYNSAEIKKPTENGGVKYCIGVNRSSENDYGKPITFEDVKKLRSIGRKSINNFTSGDVKKAQKWAYKFYQELGIKSPFFRAWFGDWRARDNSSVAFAEIPEYKATNKARKSNRGIYRNTDTGWDITVSREGETNTISHSGKGHLSEYGLAGIKELVENAVLFDAEVHEHHKNNPKNDNIAFDHKLYSLGIDSYGNINLYKITVEEYYQSKTEPNNKKFHNLKYIEKVANISADALSGKASSGGSANETLTTTYSISDLYNLVKKYDKDFTAGKAVNPAMLNEDGTPKGLVFTMLLR